MNSVKGKWDDQRCLSADHSNFSYKPAFQKEKIYKYEPKPASPISRSFKRRINFSNKTLTRSVLYVPSDMTEYPFEVKQLSTEIRDSGNEEPETLDVKIAYYKELLHYYSTATCEREVGLRFCPKQYCSLMISLLKNIWNPNNRVEDTIDLIVYSDANSQLSPQYDYDPDTLKAAELSNPEQLAWPVPGEKARHIFISDAPEVLMRPICMSHYDACLFFSKAGYRLAEPRCYRGIRHDIGVDERLIDFFEYAEINPNGEPLSRVITNHEYFKKTGVPLTTLDEFGYVLDQRARILAESFEGRQQDRTDEEIFDTRDHSLSTQQRVSYRGFIPNDVFKNRETGVYLPEKFYRDFKYRKNMVDGEFYDEKNIFEDEHLINCISTLMNTSGSLGDMSDWKFDLKSGNDLNFDENKTIDQCNLSGDHEDVIANTSSVYSDKSSDCHDYGCSQHDICLQYPDELNYCRNRWLMKLCGLDYYHRPSRQTETSGHVSAGEIEKDFYELELVNQRGISSKGKYSRWNTTDNGNEVFFDCGKNFKTSQDNVDRSRTSRDLVYSDEITDSVDHLNSSNNDLRQVYSSHDNLQDSCFYQNDGRNNRHDLGKSETEEYSSFFPRRSEFNKIPSSGPDDLKVSSRIPRPYEGLDSCPNRNSSLSGKAFLKNTPDSRRDLVSDLMNDSVQNTRLVIYNTRPANSYHKVDSCECRGKSQNCVMEVDFCCCQDGQKFIYSMKNDRYIMDKTDFRRGKSFCTTNKHESFDSIPNYTRDKGKASETSGSAGNYIEETKTSTPLSVDNLKRTTKSLSPEILQKRTMDRYSRKVFVGGLPQDITEEQLFNIFSVHGDLDIDWPYKSHSVMGQLPKGYVFLLFKDSCSVPKLLQVSSKANGKHYIAVSSDRSDSKQVQIRPWSFTDAHYENISLKIEHAEESWKDFTIFLGGIPRQTTAKEVAISVEACFGPVVEAHIDVDSEFKYPKGAASVQFLGKAAFFSSLKNRYVIMKLGGTEKKLEIKPYYSEDKKCTHSELVTNLDTGSKNSAANIYFCASYNCLKFFCSECWVHHYESHDNCVHYFVHSISNSKIFNRRYDEHHKSEHHVPRLTWDSLPTGRRGNFHRQASLDFGNSYNPE